MKWKISKWMNQRLCKEGSPERKRREITNNKSWTWKRLTPCSCEALWNNSFIPFWFQDEELVDAKFSTLEVLPLIIVAVYLVTACHTTLHLIYSCHVTGLTLTSRREILRYIFNPPSLHPNSHLDWALPPICSLSSRTPRLSSNVHVYIFFLCVISWRKQF